MAERTDTRTRDSEVDLDAELGTSDAGSVDTDFGSVMGTDEGASTETSETSKGGIRSRIKGKLNSFFSVRTFGVALLLTVVLAFVAGAFVPIIPGSALLGVFFGGFLLGVASDERSYLEIGAATLLSGAITALLGNITLTLLGVGMPLVAFGAGASGVAGVLGHYFGRDLRAGLTQDIE